LSTPRLILRPPAVRDMEECAVYLASKNPAAADRFLDSCMSDFARLSEMPGMGAPRSFRNPKTSGIRSWPLTGFRNYLVFYRPIEDGIEVLRVLHGARDIDAIFE
jgi:toxin ParE1/3/4